MATRTGSAVWEGTLKEGKGDMKLGSGAFEGPYSFSSRFEEGKGTNPEELIGAAEAGCYSMALSANLEKAGHPAKRISTVATVKLEMVGGGPKITTIDLKTEAEVPGIDEAKFKEQAELTKKTCPVSIALAGTQINLEARLLSGVSPARLKLQPTQLPVQLGSLLSQLVEIFHERHHRAVESLYFRVCRFDNVILVRRMRAAAVAEPEMSGGKFQRFTGENISWIRTRIARPE